MKSIASVFILILMMSSHAHAREDQKGFCQNAQTTADLVMCVGDHNKAEMDHMTALYHDIEKYNQGNTEFLSELNAQQTQWLALKDKICALEAKIYEGGSLARIQDISCHARKTSERAQHFKTVLESGDDKIIPEFSYPPRWVNVLKADYGDVFWQLASFKMVDTDCDGQQENIISGLRRTEGGYESVLGISDSSATGRPATTLLDFENGKDCKIDNQYSLINLPEPKPLEGENLKCIQNIIVETARCGQYILTKNNDQYDLKKKVKNERN